MTILERAGPDSGEIETPELPEQLQASFQASLQYTHICTVAHHVKYHVKGSPFAQYTVKSWIVLGVFKLVITFFGEKV